jgi:hypothetical protein
MYTPLPISFAGGVDFEHIVEYPKFQPEYSNENGQ